VPRHLDAKPLRPFCPIQLSVNYHSGRVGASGVRRVVSAVTLLVSALVLLWRPAALAQGAAAGAGAVPGPVAVAASRQATNVAIITIHGEIDSGGGGQSVMASSVKRRLDTAVRAGADAIVFDINTPGGEIGAVLRICTMIKACPIPNTIAWINPDAYSGGAIIALACREIIVSDPSAFGDAMPIAMGGPGGASAPTGELLRKILPPLISEVVDSARRYNQTFGGYLRDEYLVQSLVANDVELWWVQHRETGVRMAIDREEFALLFPGEGTAGPTRLASVPGVGPPGGGRSDGRSGEAMPIPGDVPTPLPDPTSAETSPAGSEKLAAVAGEVEQNQTIPTTRPRLSAADAGRWMLIDKISDGSGPTLLKAEDMLHYGLASNDTQVVNGRTVLKPIRTDEELATFLQATNVRRLQSSWSEGLVLFLTNVAVRAVILVIFLIAVFVEMTNPGTLLPGLIALVTLGLLVGPPMLIGLANWWEVAAILSGIVLIALEAFVIPGFGVPGICGLILLFSGLVFTFVPQGSGLFPTSPSGQEGLLWGSATILLSFFTAGLAMYGIAKHFGSLPLLGRLVLRDPATADESEGYLAAMEHETAEVRAGATGVTLTPMRPAGRVDLGSRVVDAAAEFGFIPAGARVRVVSVTGMRIGVEPVPDAGPTGAGSTGSEGAT